MAKTVYVVDQRKDRSEWLVILAAGAMIVFWKYILLVAICMAVSWLLVQTYLKISEIKFERKVKQERAWMDAPTKLITEGLRVWGNPEHYLNDYDDGLRQWQ